MPFSLDTRGNDQMYLLFLIQNASKEQSYKEWLMNEPGVSYSLYARITLPSSFFIYHPKSLIFLCNVARLRTHVLCPSPGLTLRTL